MFPLPFILATLLLPPSSLSASPAAPRVTAPAADQFAAAREVIASMQRAIAAGDARAYLALVDRGEHEWWHEQQAWAKDIAAKTPETITITPGDDWTLATLHDTPAVEVSLTWRWTPKADDRVSQPKAGDPVPASRERELTFRARFLEREGGLLYAGEAWQLVEREGVIVAFDPGLEQAAIAAAAAFATIRAGVESELGLTAGPIATRTQRIKLYGSMRHLQHSIYPSYVFPLSGWNEPNEAIKALTRPNATEKNFIALLAHEYGHVASFELGPKANAMPWWALEGIAEVMVDAHDPSLAAGSRKQVQAWQREGALADFADLADFEKVPLKLHGHVYRQGHDMMRFVTDTFGVDKRNRWLAAMSAGDSIAVASDTTLGQSWESIQQSWRDAISQPAPEPLAPNPPPAPTPASN